MFVVDEPKSRARANSLCTFKFYWRRYKRQQCARLFGARKPFPDSNQQSRNRTKNWRTNLFGSHETRRNNIIMSGKGKGKLEPDFIDACNLSTIVLTSQEKEDAEIRSQRLPRPRLVCSSRLVVSAVTFVKESSLPVWEPELLFTLRPFSNIFVPRFWNSLATPLATTRRAVLVRSIKQRTVLDSSSLLDLIYSSPPHYACHQER